MIAALSEGEANERRRKTTDKLRGVRVRECGCAVAGGSDVGGGGGGGGGACRLLRLLFAPGDAPRLAVVLHALAQAALAIGQQRVVAAALDDRGEVGERLVDELILLARLHHSAALEPHARHEPQHVHASVRAVLRHAVGHRDEATGAPDACRAVNHHWPVATRRAVRVLLDEPPGRRLGGRRPERRELLLTRRWSRRSAARTAVRRGELLRGVRWRHAGTHRSIAERSRLKLKSKLRLRERAAAAGRAVDVAGGCWRGGGDGRRCCGGVRNGWAEAPEGERVGGTEHVGEALAIALDLDDQTQQLRAARGHAVVGPRGEPVVPEHVLLAAVLRADCTRMCTNIRSCFVVAECASAGQRE